MPDSIALGGAGFLEWNRDLFVVGSYRIHLPGPKSPPEVREKLADAERRALSRDSSTTFTLKLFVIYIYIYMSIYIYIEYICI